MSIVTVSPGDEGAKEVFNQKNKFILDWQFFRATNDRKERKVRELKITLDNQDTTNYAYDLDSVNLCQSVFKNNLDLHILEINLREVPEGVTVPTNKFVSFNPSNFIIEKGTVIYTLIHFYGRTEQIDNCNDSNWNPQPRTSKGSIIVGNP